MFNDPGQNYSSKLKKKKIMNSKTQWIILYSCKAAINYNTKCFMNYLYQNNYNKLSS